MKKLISLLLVLAMAASLAACGHEHDWIPATCTEPKTCSVCGKTEGQPLGHDWGLPAYEWSEDYTTATASHVCTRDPSYVESETVRTEAKIVIPSDCDVMGERAYTATFSDPAFEAQTLTVQDVPVLGHNWDAPVYEWSDDLSSVTATHVCRRDSSHVESETVKTVAEPVEGAEDEVRYLANFSTPAFGVQQMTVTRPTDGPAAEVSGPAAAPAAEVPEAPTVLEVETVEGSLPPIEAVSESLPEEEAAEVEALLSENVEAENAAPEEEKADAELSDEKEDEISNEVPAVEEIEEELPAEEEAVEEIPEAVPEADDVEAVPEETPHIHEWQEATCTEPRTCLVCGVTEGEPLGHTWQEATCTEPRICLVCGETEGEPLGHTWQEATCVEPRTCLVCGVTEGEPLEHSWKDATCTEPRYCTVCGLIDSPALGHTWQEATCTEPKTCSVCGTTEGKPLGHTWTEEVSGVKLCSVCGLREGAPAGIPYFDRSFAEYRHDFNYSYAGFLKITPREDSGFVLTISGDVMSVSDMYDPVAQQMRPILVHHADAYDPASPAWDEGVELERFNTLTITYVAESDAYNVMTAWNVAFVSYMASRIFDTSLSQDDFILSLHDILDSDGKTLSFSRNGIDHVYTCGVNGDGVYQYTFTISLAPDAA